MSIMNQDIDTVRHFYAAVAARDLGTAEACFALDATWHLPGNSPIAGDYIGWAAIRDDLLARLGPLSGYTFQAELLDVAIGQEYIVAVQRATAAYQGRQLDVTGCQLMRMKHGRIAEVRGHYSDQCALDAFWKTD